MHLLSDKLKLIWGITHLVDDECRLLTRRLQNAEEWLPISVGNISAIRTRHESAGLLNDVQTTLDFELLAGAASGSEDVCFGLRGSCKAISATHALVMALKQFVQLRLEIFEDASRAVLDETQGESLKKFMQPMPIDMHPPEWLDEFCETDFWRAISFHRASLLSDTCDVFNWGKKADAEIRAAHRTSVPDSLEAIGNDVNVQNVIFEASDVSVGHNNQSVHAIESRDSRELDSELRPPSQADPLAKTSERHGCSDQRPTWDKEKMELSYDGVVVRAFSRKAKNCFPVLDAFEEMNWPDRIDCPLRDADSEKRANTVKALNRDISRIRFQRDGKNAGFTWLPVQRAL